MSAAAPMPALRRPWEQALLAEPNYLASIATAIDGPFHVVHPETFAENLSAFSEVFDDLGVTGAIRFGSKANKSRAFVTACAQAAETTAHAGRFGVDVASEGEFIAALGAGVRGEEIMVTGPLPSPRLQRLARRHRAHVAVDTLGSLRSLIASATPEPLNIVIRLRQATGTSRFGCTDDDVRAALDELIDVEHLRLRGFSFHLTGYDLTMRTESAHRAIDWCLRARDAGHQIDVVSLGGGLPITYVGEADWDHYREREAGNWYWDGRVAGGLYPYAGTPSGPAALRTVLAQQVSGHTDTIADRARDGQFAVMIEPGRALCDGAGVSVFTVRTVDTRSDGTSIITVDGSSLSLSEQWFNSEFLPDPVVVSRAAAAADSPTFPAAVAGGTCLDSDFLSRRLIPFPSPPQPGDLLVYPNTAGYQMDSNESEFHRQPLPPKVVLSGSVATTLKWSLER